MELKVIQGETLSLTVTCDDLTADTVRFIAKDDILGVVVDETESFATSGNKRVATIQTNQTWIAPGEYKYMLTVTYTDSIVDKFPVNCEDDCEYPLLTICEALDEEQS